MLELDKWVIPKILSLCCMDPTKKVWLLKSRDGSLNVEVTLFMRISIATQSKIFLSNAWSGATIRQTLITKQKHFVHLPKTSFRCMFRLGLVLCAPKLLFLYLKFLIVFMILFLEVDLENSKQILHAFSLTIAISKKRAKVPKFHTSMFRYLQGPKVRLKWRS